MASFRDRFLNLFDDHQEKERLAEGRRLTEQMRDNLLGQTLTVKEDWVEELKITAPEEIAEVNGYYRGRLDEINNSLAELRNLNPAINVQVNPTEFQNAAMMEAQVEFATPSPSAANLEFRLQEALQAGAQSLDRSYAYTSDAATIQLETDPDSSLNRSYEHHPERERDQEQSLEQSVEMGM